MRKSSRLRQASATDTALKLYVVLARAHAAVARHADAHAAEHDLTPAEFGILDALYHLGPLLLGELQRKILVSSGGVTYLVDRLTERGLVQRRDSPTDRRARYVALTPAGERLLDRIFPEHARRIAQAVAGLSPQQQADVTALLRQLGTTAEERFP